MADIAAPAPTTMDRKSGICKWFDNSKGYGFISPAEGEEDYFVHQSSLHTDGGFRSLEEGEEVEFDVFTEESGRTKAVNVTGPGGTFVKGSRRTRKRGGACYNCGGEGHLARDCANTTGGRACYNCGAEGHLARECPTAEASESRPARPGRSASNSRCYNCGNMGHLARDCEKPESAGRACYTCGQEGHRARDCPSGTGEAPAARACYNCGETGHLARACPTGNEY